MVRFYKAAIPLDAVGRFCLCSCVLPIKLFDGLRARPAKPLRHTENSGICLTCSCGNAKFSATTDMPPTVCHHCTAENAPSAYACHRCGYSFIDAPLDETNGERRLLAMASMGRSEMARTFGVTFVVINAVLILFQTTKLMMADETSIEFSSLVAHSVIAVCTYEVWAFTHGKATFIDTRRLEPVAERTTIRTVGLLGDLLVWASLVWYVL
jgi:hypothetical protein